jgi:tRNA threonylcarbamoyladenosine modification (KEOPS) complex Cgi121 subunit
MAENTTFVGVQNNNQGQVQFATGKVTFGADSITAADYIEIDLGFQPKYVNFVNATDRISVEHFAGMAANTCLKSAAAGTNTLETTNGGITLTTTGFRVTQNATLAVIAASTVCYWKAQG